MLDATTHKKLVGISGGAAGVETGLVSQAGETAEQLSAMRKHQWWVWLPEASMKTSSLGGFLGSQGCTPNDTGRPFVARGLLSWLVTLHSLEYRSKSSTLGEHPKILWDVLGLIFGYISVWPTPISRPAHESWVTISVGVWRHVTTLESSGPLKECRWAKHHLSWLKPPERRDKAPADAGFPG